MRVDPSTLVLAGLALVLAVVAYVRDPGLPWLGAKTGFSMLGFILPRLIPALILAGLMQVLVLAAYMTSWSLFGMQRIIAWEAPLMGWRFVIVRVVPSLAFPVLAGWLVATFYHE